MQDDHLGKGMLKRVSLLHRNAIHLLSFQLTEYFNRGVWNDVVGGLHLLPPLGMK